MKTVNVKAKVTYDYQVEIPDDEEGRHAMVDIASYCDSADPVYFAICKLMTNEGIPMEGELLSIVDDDTDEVLWDSE